VVESINKKVELVIKATAFTGLTDYGQIMIGDQGFEFYNERDARKFIQIPWKDVDYVIASIMFKGKWIPRYALKTKQNGTFTFASKEPKKVLRAVREHVPADHIVQSLSFMDVVKRALHFKRKNK
jgi:hypothetical protein